MLVNCTDYSGTAEKCNITSAASGPSVMVVVVLSCIYSLISVVALIGNTLVCLVIIRNPVMRTVVNAFLLNLAISDILFIIVTVPGYLVIQFMPTWPLGETFCKAIPFLNTVTLSASIYTMVALAIDRYNAIVNPLRAKVTHTLKRATIVITLIWIFSAIVAFPQVLSRSLLKGKDCIEDWTRMNNLLGKQIYTVAIFIIFFAVPVTMITIAYVTIIKRMRKDDALLKDAVRIKQEQDSEEINLARSAKIQPISRRKRKSLLMMLTVIVAFLVFMLPLNVLLLVAPFLIPGNYDRDTLITATNVLAVLSVCSSACNPIIYNFFSDKFRRAFANVFRCKCAVHASNGSMRMQLSFLNSKRMSTSF